MLSLLLLAFAAPNVVVILADDVGYGDLGCYGATKVKTPNLDALAAKGLRFTDGHAPSSMCSPTRYALLTGRYAWRNPATARGVLSGLAPLCIEPGSFTLPAMLEKQGYVTGVVGKWHLGLGKGAPDYNAEIRPGPREIGFDSSFIIPATGDRVPCVYVEDGRVAGLDPKDPIRVSYGKPVGDEPTGKSRPDLLKMKPSVGHADTIVNGISRIGFMAGGKAARWKDEDMADVLTKKAVAFIEKNHAKPFFLYFATHDWHVPRVPHPRFAGKSGHGTPRDTIQQLDWCVGELMKALDAHKLADDTLVIFSSDNGGVMDDGYIDGTGDDKSGHKCNGPLRGFKVGLYEGGHRVPLIMRWPAKVKPGVRDQLAALVDLPATVAALTGAKLAEADAPDSHDLSDLLTDAKKEGRSHLVMHSGGGVLAYREGPWKLVPPHGPMAKGKKAELYNLADDLGEKTDLAAKEPERVKTMQEKLEAARTKGEEPMNPALALHTAARRYCLERFDFWTACYSGLVRKGQDRRGGDYTPEALATFPRYNVLDAIRVELERLDPAALGDFEETRALLDRAGEMAEDDRTCRPIGEIDRAAMAEEREAFRRHVRGLTRSEASEVEPLPYRRVLTAEESGTIWPRLRARWQIAEGHWYPLVDCSLTEIVAFDAGAFAEAVPVEGLQSLLSSRGVGRVWELREYGPEYEQDVSLFQPRYTGAEGYWSSGDLDWIVYASHESSVTVGGWLLDEVKRFWPSWQAGVWTGVVFDRTPR